MNESMQALKELAEKLGQRLETLWPIAVRYVVVDAVVSLTLVGVLLPLGSTLLARRFWKKLGTRDSHDEGLGKVLIAFVLLFVYCFAIVAFVQAVPMIINPEGFLITKLLERK